MSMKFPAWPRRAIAATAYGLRRTAALLVKGVAALLAPIGFREVLLLSGSALVGLGSAEVYPPAAYIAPGLALLGVAVFGVRA